MKLYIKQKAFSFKNKFTIKDEHENDLYTVEGSAYSFVHKLHIYNDMNDEVALIKQKAFAFKPTFEVHIQDKVVTSIKREYTFLKQKFNLSNLDWQVTGNMSDHNYSISKNEVVIATISKAWFSWGDSYEIAINEECDIVLVIATVLAIDCATSDDNSLIN